MPLSACAGDIQPSGEEQTTLGSASALDEIPAATFVVLYKREAVPKSAKKDIEKAGGELVASYPEIGVVIATGHTQSFASKLEARPEIDSVAATTGAGTSALPVHMAWSDVKSPRPAPTSPEPLSGYQWNNDIIHVKEAHRITKGAKSVMVAVMDSGVDDSLPDLKGQISAGNSASCIGGFADTRHDSWGRDIVGHGSHVAGIIAAKENGHGIGGIAPGVTLASIKVTDDGFVYPESFICGMYWAATHDIPLVNGSIYIDPWYFSCPSDPVQKTLMTAQQRAVNFASRKGTTMFAAASNEQIDLAHPTVDYFSPTDAETVERNIDSSCKLLPVGLDGVIGVSAIGGDKNMAYYSNYGLGIVDIASPGGDLHVPMPGNASGQILSPMPSDSWYFLDAINWNGRVGVNCADGLDPNDPNSDPSTCAETYGLMQGTSMATPHATAVAALVMSRFGKLSPTLLKAHMGLRAQHTACPANPYQPYPDDMPEMNCEGSPLYNGFYGSGIADAYAAVR
ncbi:MAG: S8 family serine peptidase [Myxococcales bacterium]